MQLAKDVFPYVVGYHGETAIVDKKLRRYCQGKDMSTLISEGYLKVAFCQALFHGEETLEQVAALYNQQAGTHYSAQAMKRLLGVFEITQAQKIRFI